MRPAHVQRYIAAFEHLRPSTLQAMQDCFAEGAHFVDPFNDVHGKIAIRRVFEHMFANCEDPRFAVDECLGDDGLVYLRWRFSFGSATARRHVQGVSRVRFTPDGRVAEHIDYWDPASQLYEHIPIVGRLVRALRNRLAAAQPRRSDSNPIHSATTQRNRT